MTTEATTELEANHAAAMAATEFVGKRSVWVGPQLAIYQWIENVTPKFQWSITVSWSSGVESGNSATFEDALAEVLKKLEKVKNLCPVCGGRMDNECKHSHGEAQP